MDEQIVKKARSRGQTGNRARRPRLSSAVALGLFAILAVGGCRGRYDDLDLTMYRYRDTRNLVKFVYDASRVLKTEGASGLSYLQSHRQLYKTPDHYLYVYDADGTNLFHAGMEDLEGKNLRDVTDKDGKPVFQQVVEALEDDNNPHAWVHYSWWEPGRFYPVPKSSCHFRVETAEGHILIVGGGIN